MQKSFFFLFKIVLSLVIVFLVFSSNAYAINKYWIGSTSGNFNANTRWSLTSGGPNNTTAPTANDVAIFDANGGGGCKMTMAHTVAGITNAGGYSSTGFDTSNYNLTINGNFQWSTSPFRAGSSVITVAGNWNFSGTTFLCSSSTVVLTGAANTLVTGTGTQFNNLTINSGANITTQSSFTVNSILTISGTFAVDTGKTVTVNNGQTMVINTGGILSGNGTLIKNISITNDNVSTTGTISIVNFQYNLLGSTSKFVTARAYGGNLTINSAESGDRSAQLTAGTLTVTGTLKISSGGGGMVVLDNSVNNSSIVVGNLSVGDSGVPANKGKLITGTGAVTVNGNVTIEASDTSGDNTIDATGASTWNVSGNWTNKDIFLSRTSTTTFDAGTSGKTITSGSSSFYNVVFNNASGNWTLQDAMTVGNNFTVTNSSISGNGVDLNSKTINITGNFTISAGKVTAGSAIITVGGNWTNNGAFVPGASTVTFNAGTTGKTIMSGGSSFYKITFNSVLGDWILQDALTANNDFTVMNSAISGNGIDLNSKTVNITGNFTISAGKVTAGSAIITVGGNWTNNGTCITSAATVILNGTNQTIYGSNTFYNLTKNVTTASTLYVQAGSIQTVINNLTLTGTNTGLLSLMSTSPGSYWYIDPQGFSSVSFANISDLYNLGISNIVGANSVDSGHNNNVSFGGSGCACQIPLHLPFLKSDLCEDTFMKGLCSPLWQRGLRGDFMKQAMSDYWRLSC